MGDRFLLRIKTTVARTTIAIPAAIPAYSIKAQGTVLDTLIVSSTVFPDTVTLVDCPMYPAREISNL